MTRIALPVSALILTLIGVWVGSYATLELSLTDWRAIPGILTAALLLCCGFGMLLHWTLVPDIE